MWNKRVFFLLPPSRSPSIIPGRACKSRKQDSLQIYGSQGTCRCSVNSRKLSLHRTIHQGFPKTHVCSKVRENVLLRAWGGEHFMEAVSAESGAVVRDRGSFHCHKLMETSLFYFSKSKPN
ncbi:uncharacterized protein [Physcomitrium patens]|uniref:uncharacterized protein isoform X3 n=1 Tax=Physcomitrium patens TaxID=3218 RepID=UPI003CCDE567